MERPKSGMEQAIDRMESPVELLSNLPSLGEAAQVSMAISLKRIADVLEGSLQTGHADGRTLHDLVASIEMNGRN